MKVEKSAHASLEANKTDRNLNTNKDVSTEAAVDSSAGKNSKLYESATIDSYRAFTLQRRFNESAVSLIAAAANAASAVAFQAQNYTVENNGSSRSLNATAAAPSPHTFTSFEGHAIPDDQVWLTNLGTESSAESAAQDLKNSSGPQAFQQFIEHLDQHQTDADWLQGFYESLGTEDTARLMSQADEMWYTDSESGVEVIRNSFLALAENGRLNQADLDKLLLTAAAPNSDLGSPPLFNGLAAGVFAELPNTAAGTALKEMFFDSATRLAFGELRSSNELFDARLDSFANNFAAAATEVLGTASSATQIQALSALNSRERLTEFTSMATQGYRPADAPHGITSLGRLEELLNTAASYGPSVANQANIDLSDLRVGMYNGVLLGMMESRGQATHNFAGNETFREAIGGIFISEQNQILADYPQAQVETLAGAGDDRVSDGLYLGANDRLYVPGTPLALIPAVRPNNGQPPIGRTIYVNGIRTNTADQAVSLQAIADQTGMEVIGIRNSTEGSVTDVAQSISDKARSGVNPPVDTLATAIYDEITAGRTIHLMAHSQGGIIASRALRDVSERLEAEGLTRAEVEEMLGKVEVETFAGAAWSYPDGPQYVHYINNIDGTPRVGGGGQVDVGPFDLDVHPWDFSVIADLAIDFGPGRNAAVHRFAEDRGALWTNNHDFNSLYLGWRVPFDEARNNPEVGLAFEVLDRSSNKRIDEMRQELNLMPEQIRDLAVIYQESLLRGSGHGVVLENFTNLSRAFNLSNVQTEELLRAIGSDSTTPDGDIIIFMDQIHRRPEFQSAFGGELTREEWKLGFENLINELGNNPDRQAQIESYQRVLDYLNNLPG